MEMRADKIGKMSRIEIQEVTHIMTTLDISLKTLALSALFAAGGASAALPGGPPLEQWYGGQSTGFWGLSSSVGVRGALPGAFSPPGSNSESLNALRQYGGYRISDAFAIEGAQTQFGANAAGGCESSGVGEANLACSHSAWSLSGVASVPVTSGLSLYGKLGLQYWQRGFQEPDPAHRNADEPGSLGKVYGVGLSYDLNKSVSFHAESERYSELGGNNATGPNASVGLDSSVHSIGLSIKF